VVAIAEVAWIGAVSSTRTTSPLPALSVAGIYFMGPAIFVTRAVLEIYSGQVRSLSE
jgi:hypothetical protein